MTGNRRILDAVTEQPDLVALARSIVESNQFMTLGTADEEGVPWVSPVWYASTDARAFYWVSKPDARHSRNLVSRPQVAIVIFDSHRTGGWNGLYMSAQAEEQVDVNEGIEIFSRRSQEKGFPAWTAENVRAPARHRLYRATAHEHFVLDPHDQRLPVNLG